jgi:GNAT superfamily N-acetyltransferase
MTISVRRAESDSDLEALALVIDDVTPDETTTVPLMRAADAAFPGVARFVANVDGGVVGAAATGRFYIYPPDYPAGWAILVVREEARRQGVGEALLGAISDEARAQGLSAIQVVASEDRPDGVSFLLHRGFVVRERRLICRLAVAGLEAPVFSDPPGVRITTLAERPDLVTGVHRVALEGFADIPGADRRGPGDIEEFRQRYVERTTIPADAYFVAQCTDTWDVVGYASLKLRSVGGTVASHYMTTVGRAWRGRGIATALKQRTVTWAADNGIEYLESDPHDTNAALRAINARLGYVEVDALLTMRGPLATTDPALETAVGGRAAR